MSIPETNTVGVLQCLFDEVWNKGDLSFADRIFIHATPAVAFIAGFRTAFPDIRHTVEASVVAGEDVVIRWQATATHQGIWEGILPTQRAVVFTGMMMATVRGGKIHQHYTEWDKAGLLVQLMQSDQT
jgi:predicted ester cyclase